MRSIQSTLQPLPQHMQINLGNSLFVWLCQVGNSNLVVCACMLVNVFLSEPVSQWHYACVFCTSSFKVACAMVLNFSTCWCHPGLAWSWGPGSLEKPVLCVPGPLFLCTLDLWTTATQINGTQAWLETPDPEPGLKGVKVRHGHCVSEVALFPTASKSFVNKFWHYDKVWGWPFNLSMHPALLLYLHPPQLLIILMTKLFRQSGVWEVSFLICLLCSIDAG